MPRSSTPSDATIVESGSIARPRSIAFSTIADGGPLPVLGGEEKALGAMMMRLEEAASLGIDEAGAAGRADCSMGSFAAEVTTPSSSAVLSR
jgi:hypothetical protein